MPKGGSGLRAAACMIPVSLSSADDQGLQLQLKSGSQQTRRWRKMDSNRRSPPIWTMVFAWILGLDSLPDKPNGHAGYVSVLYSRLRIGSAQRFPEARRLTAENFMRSIFARAGRRPRIAARLEFDAGRRPVPAQSHNPTCPLGLWGLARDRAKAAPVASN